jgi:hypothetical protein
MFDIKIMSKAFLNRIDTIINIDDNNYTPETIAWKLLMDSELENLKNKLQIVNDLEDDDTYTLYFEMLITILMEMIYGILEINYYSKLEEKNKEELFKPTFDKKDIENNIDSIKEKFSKIGIQLFVKIFDINEDDREYLNKLIRRSYCRIALRHSERDKQFFEMHSDKIPDNKYYWFINNQTYQRKDNIKDILATCIFDNTFCSISFSEL